ncbi:spore cortex biosynthesis protein YabQ [Cytobacillus eiseniae]|uniref:Spore cortex biosynthesis protein YabQ n=1 Tax=Cytobacillus eiseniae TaxID=762947 RepID=A0ABS4RJW7_9BACI|nr:spore cortex biosynthesis protein YabQ [Cytobacillus eiseniae]MBP2242594.1 spore cortex biosynthesis protein YabQ [Cytobacillus eiseniae]
MTLTTQFITMLAMVGMGSVFGASLDTYNRFLKRVERNRLIVFLNDILFWIVQGLAIFYILFLVNRGELRFYIFIALLCGFAAYQSLFKDIYLRLLEITISMIIRFLRFLQKLFYYLIYKPINGLVVALIALLFFFGRVLLSLLKMLQKIVLYILKLIFLPIKWVLWIMWKIMPNNSKKMIEKIFNRLAGYSKKIKNYILKGISKWKKDKK